MIRILLLLLAIAIAPIAYAQDDGMPFGRISSADVDNLYAFAKSSNLDLEAELKQAYKRDLVALGKVFSFSLRLHTLDTNAKTYGQIIYSSLLNLGEGMGVEAYALVLSKQSPEVQQRVRDFLYYPITKAPKDHQAEAAKETRQAYPTLFPKGYTFGHQNPIFRK